MAITVTFDPIQLEAAKSVARRRVRENWDRGTQDKHGAPRGRAGALLHLWGAKTELAVAIHYHLPWDPVGTWGIRDVANLEVRSIPSRSRRLIIHPEDRDDTPFLLAFTPDQPDATEVVLLGWQWGRLGKQPEYWSDPTGENRHAFFVPQRALEPMDTLRVPRPAQGCPALPLHDRQGLALPNPA